MRGFFRLKTLFRRFISLFFVLLLFGFSGSRNYPELKPETIHPRVEQAIKFTLQKYHYKDVEINDSLSAQMYDRYIERLDFNRSYFLEADIKAFQKYRYTLDDALGQGNLDFSFEVYGVFQQRFQERKDYIDQILQTEFDFSGDDYYQPDRSEAPWARTNAQLDSIWYKRIKDEILRLKLAGKEWSEIVGALKKRYDNWDRSMQKSKSEDVFRVYMNSFAESFDPHTNYMSPNLSDDFKIRMSQSLEGIGASLGTDNEYTKVVEIIPGGPADKSGLLKADDRIIGVGQNEDGEMVDVIGWRIDDVVQLIRGPKSTLVRLQVLPAGDPMDAPPKTIKIVRDKVKLSDQVAKSKILEVNQEGQLYKIGVIEIPSFYFDYEGMRRGDASFASTSRDVKRILKELEDQGVQGIVIDLRDNGGGFLSEAIELTGLFIKAGPVVQVRNTDGSIKIEQDMDGQIFYDGPLAILVNSFSASASEIFAAAIQDYGRGLILGNQTYGKGTVQNVIQLNKLFPNSKDKYGLVKLTVAKFYRINGGSTQHAGVMPDISLPSRWDHAEVGESAQKNALLWDEINPVKYNSYHSGLPGIMSTLKIRHQSRIQSNLQFRNLLAEILEQEKQEQEKVISLNFEKRKKARDEAEAKRVSPDREADDEDENPESKEERDLFLIESANILGDWVVLKGKN